VLNDPQGDQHGMTFFSYMPIKDDTGRVVAVIATDINMQSLAAQLDSFLTTSISTTAIASILIISIMFFALRRLIIRPIQKLTMISDDIAEGNIDASVPGWIQNRKDEMGILGKSYESMNVVLREMIQGNNALFEAAMSGQLDARSDPSAFQGSFAQVANQINDTLDIIGIYLDSIPGSLAILNAEYDIVFSNGHFKALFAEYTGEAIYRKMLEAGEDEDYPALKRLLKDRLDRGDYASVVWFEFGAQRRSLSFLISRVAHEGQESGAILVAMDSTELVDAKDRALMASKAKSEFLSRVSHELRTPLNAILGMARLGLNDQQVEESVERFRKIVTSSSHLSSIINDVLEMSRMESDKLEIKREPMNIRSVIEESVELLLAQAQEKGIALTSSIASDIPEALVGDEFRVRQILINLLSNAVKFTIKGQVSLEVTIAEGGEDGVALRFAVSDTGVGMSEEFLEKVFVPFEQEDSFLNRRFEGSGLGLSISYNLAILMGGQMTVQSKLEEGSRFECVIPFASAGSEWTGDADETPDDDEVSLQGKHILLADDIEINRIIVRELFADNGVIFEEAEDGEEAYRKFLQSPVGDFDCILMDVQMPKMDGYEATHSIRASGRADSDVPVIAMTANALKEDIERALEAGMTDHVAKPVDFDVAMRTVKKHCAGKE